MWRTKTWGGQRWYHGEPQGHGEGFVLDSKGDRSHWGLDPFASWDSTSGFIARRPWEAPSKCSQLSVTGAGTDPTLAPQVGLDASWSRGHVACRTCPWPLPLHYYRDRARFWFLCSAVWLCGRRLGIFCRLPPSTSKGPCTAGTPTRPLTACNSAICPPGLRDSPYACSVPRDRANCPRKGVPEDTYWASDLQPACLIGKKPVGGGDGEGGG